MMTTATMLLLTKTTRSQCQHDDNELPTTKIKKPLLQAKQEASANNNDNNHLPSPTKLSHCHKATRICH